MSEALSTNSVLFRRWYTSHITKSKNYPVVLSAILVLAIVYFISSKLGFTMSHQAKQVTLVWPPTGISLAALLLLGPRLWPGIWLGAFLANVTQNEPILSAFGIATGNTMEALAGMWMLQRMGFNNALARMKDVVALCICAALISTAISATIGVISLCLGSVQPWHAFTSLWWKWWVGDATGDLIFAPLLLVWCSSPHSLRQGRSTDEELALLVGLAAACVFIFVEPYTVTPASELFFIYSIFPFTFWTALRFGHLYTTFVTMLISFAAICATAAGQGPFNTGSTEMNLLMLQLFMASVSAIGLFLGAVVNEKKVLAHQQHIAYTVSHILNAAPSSRDTIHKMLEALGTTSESDFVAFWGVDEQANTANCMEVWYNPVLRFPEFITATRQLTISRGIGIAGRVWATKAPVWIADLQKDNNFKRRQAAEREGLYGAFAIPVTYNNRVLGVIEFLSYEVRQPDYHTLRMYGMVSNQIGQFLELVHTKQVLSASEAMALKA